jgi:hypothetical protein
MPKKTETEEGKVVIKKGKRLLKVDLTREELLQAGEGMAQAQKEVAVLESELDSVKKQYGAKVMEAEVRRDRAANLIRDKFEFRDVEIETRLDYTSGMVRVARVDTGEVIEARKMTEDEKQMEMEV